MHSVYLQMCVKLEAAYCNISKAIEIKVKIQMCLPNKEYCMSKYFMYILMLHRYMLPKYETDALKFVICMIAYRHTHTQTTILDSIGMAGKAKSTN